MRALPTSSSSSSSPSPTMGAAVSAPQAALSLPATGRAQPGTDPFFQELGGEVVYDKRCAHSTPLPARLGLELTRAMQHGILSLPQERPRPPQERRPRRQGLRQARPGPLAQAVPPSHQRCVCVPLLRRTVTRWLTLPPSRQQPSEMLSSSARTSSPTAALSRRSAQGTSCASGSRATCTTASGASRPSLELGGAASRRPPRSLLPTCALQHSALPHLGREALDRLSAPDRPQARTRTRCTSSSLQLSAHAAALADPAVSPSSLARSQISHGDIKTENVVVTTWNWAYLTDFSSAFKPTFLPLDDPSAFSFYFDTSSRRTCYLAPERFYAAGSDTARKKDALEFGKRDGKVTEAMDVFSLGCVLAELWMEGTPPFTLSQLFKYREGEYNLETYLAEIEDVEIRVRPLFPSLLRAPSPPLRRTRAHTSTSRDSRSSAAWFHSTLRPASRSPTTSPSTARPPSPTSSTPSCTRSSRASTSPRPPRRRPPRHLILHRPHRHGPGRARPPRRLRARRSSSRRCCAPTPTTASSASGPSGRSLRGTSTRRSSSRARERARKESLGLKRDEERCVGSLSDPLAAPGRFADSPRQQGLFPVRLHLPGQEGMVVEGGNVSEGASSDLSSSFSGVRALTCPPSRSQTVRPSSSSRSCAPTFATASVPPRSCARSRSSSPSTGTSRTRRASTASCRTSSRSSRTTSPPCARSPCAPSRRRSSSCAASRPRTSTSSPSTSCPTRGRSRPTPRSSRGRCTRCASPRSPRRRSGSSRWPRR